MAEIEKTDLKSENLIDDRLQQLRELMPEAFSESGIDFDKLRLLLGDEVDEGDERYAFMWPGKANAIRQSQTSTTATLRPVVEKSRSRDGKDGSFDSDNIYIEGDNLEALKLLQRAYHGKVKLIYIDPPYNTGHDFVYKDKFGNTIENYKELTGQINQSNPETSGRFHSKWCSMMYPRLRLARELLSDDGVLFISIDDNEQKNLSNICDEIFGEACFVTDIIWRSSDASNNDAKTFSADFNHTLVYSRMSGWIAQRLPRRAKDNEHYKNRDNDPRGPWFSGNVSSPNPRENLRYVVRSPQGVDIQPPKNGWRWSKERMNEMIAAKEIVFSADGTRIIKKTFLKDQAGIVPSNLWIDLEETGHNRNAKYELMRLFPELPSSALFKTPKPTKLLRKILKLINWDDGNPNIVLDFFAGSSTTADAVIQENEADGKHRRWILVQLPEAEPKDSPAFEAGYHNLCDIGEERIRRASDKVFEEVAEANKQLKFEESPIELPDIGFRVFKLDDSGIKQPREGQLLINRRKDGRSDLDIIFEVMLKWGYELTYPIEKAKFAGYECYSVAEGDLICCMEPNLTVDALEAIAAKLPRRVFIMDSVFGGDDSLKLDALAIFKHVEEQTQQKIELRTV